MEQDIVKLGKEINTKIDAIEKRVGEINEIAEKNGKIPEKFEGEMKKLGTDMSDALREYKTYMEKAETFQSDMEAKFKEKSEKDEKRMNELDVELQKRQTTQRNEGNFSAHVDEIVDNQKDALIEVAENKRVSTLIEIKADMTLGADFTGEVIDRDRIPGVFFDPARRVHIRSFMNVTPTKTDVIRYVTESEFTDGASAKAEGVAASQTDFKLESVDETIRKINTYLTISKEMMSDAPFVKNYIKTRVVSKILAREDLEILYGSGNSPHLNGLTNQAQAYTDYIADENVQRIDVIANAITNTIVDEYWANLALVTPQDYQLIILTKDSQGRYLLPQVLAGGRLVINGGLVIPSTAMTSDDLLVGDFKLGATLAMRSGIEITFSNSHADNFIDGFITILVEERVGMPVYRSKAFVFTNFKTAMGEGTA